MEYSDKTMHYITGQDVDMQLTKRAWLNIYQLLSGSMPEETTADGMIKAVKDKFKNKKSRSWKFLRKLLLGESLTATQRGKHTLNEHNEAMLNNMNRELVPFVKELLLLTQEQGLKVRVMEMVADKEPGRMDLADFGLSFNIGVFEETAAGEYIYIGDYLSYSHIAPLAESIGLKWGADQKAMNKLSIFELRPAWALRLTDEQMFTELKRRKDFKMSLLAI